MPPFWLLFNMKYYKHEKPVDVNRCNENKQGFLINTVNMGGFLIGLAEKVFEVCEVLLYEIGTKKLLKLH